MGQMGQMGQMNQMGQMGMMGQMGGQMMGGMGMPGDAYGLGQMVTANPVPPRPLGLIQPRTPTGASSAYLWKRQPESASRVKAPTSHSRAASSDGGSAGGDRSPRSSASFSLPPSAAESRISPAPRSRPQTPPGEMVSPSALLRVPSSIGRSPPRSPMVSPRDVPEEDLLPPLRRPRDTSPPRTPQADTGAAPDRPLEAPALERPIKPKFFVHAVDRPFGTEDDAQPAPASLLPRLKRPEYYSSPSIEMMSKMSEVKLSQIDNLEIGRYGYGSIKWPGLTDVRRLDLDKIIDIERGRLTVYPEQDKPKIGTEVNKEAVISLNVKTRAAPSKAAEVKDRLAAITEQLGGKFISYDMDMWIFRLPHFGVLDNSQLQN